MAKVKSLKALGIVLIKSLMQLMGLIERSVRPRVNIFLLHSKFKKNRKKKKNLIGLYDNAILRQ